MLLITLIKVFETKSPPSIIMPLHERRAAGLARSLLTEVATFVEVVGDYQMASQPESAACGLTDTVWMSPLKSTAQVPVKVSFMQSYCVSTTFGRV